jgi:hypothetical protein
MQYYRVSAMSARKQSVLPTAWIRARRKRKRIIISDDEDELEDRGLFELDVDLWVIILRFLPSSVIINRYIICSWYNF